jgi:mono/diheme cytochrome c family protein
MQRVVFFGALVAVLLTGGSSVQAQPGNQLPEGEGRALVATACTQCHALTPIVGGREGANGWRRHVNNMVLRGAQLNAGEAETVVKYLTANFGPGIRLPDPTPVTLPAGNGKDLVETRCVVCHDLVRVAGVKRLKRDWPMIVDNMVVRGATATQEEARTIAAYLVANFGHD